MTPYSIQNAPHAYVGELICTRSGSDLQVMFDRLWRIMDTSYIR
jgi:hypothetical protein